jgi:isohexenylglutaconyl-CoA hydratase
MSDDAAIILEQDGEWLTIWFNRPDVRNALVKDLFDQLMQALDVLKSKKSFRGILFRGMGGFFCSGGDLKSFKKIATAGDQAKSMALSTSLEVAQLYKKIRELPQLTVSIVEGGAMAGGFGMACATDLLVTMADAKYALTETRIGITPAQIMPYVVERVGFAQARKLMLLASRIDGEQAHQIGMADFVAADETELLVLLDYIKTQLHACAPSAIAATKDLLAKTRLLQGDDYINYAAESFANSMVSEEGQEGFSSFIEKRIPEWAEELDEEE